MPLGKPIVVLDSNVVFSALFSSKGYSFELLKLLRAGAFQIALTPPLLFEYEYPLLKSHIFLRTRWMPSWTG
jgi:predicted nucleic acid-binding protein